MQRLLLSSQNVAGSKSQGNTCVPVKRARWPREKVTHFWLNLAWSEQASGGIQTMVPGTWVVLWNSELHAGSMSMIRELPKSFIFATLSELSKMFLAVRSRWITSGSYANLPLNAKVSILHEIGKGLAYLHNNKKGWGDSREDSSAAVLSLVLAIWSWPGGKHTGIVLCWDGGD